MHLGADMIPSQDRHTCHPPLCIQSVCVYVCISGGIFADGNKGIFGFQNRFSHSPLVCEINPLHITYEYVYIEIDDNIIKKILHFTVFHTLIHCRPTCN